MEALAQTLQSLASHPDINKISALKIEGLRWVLSQRPWSFLARALDAANAAFAANQMERLALSLSRRTSARGVDLDRIERLAKDFPGHHGEIFRNRVRVAKSGMESVSGQVSAWNKIDHVLPVSAQTRVCGKKYVVDTVSSKPVNQNRLERLTAVFDWFLTARDLSPRTSLQARVDWKRNSVHKEHCANNHYFQMNCCFYMKLFIYDQPRVFRKSVAHTIRHFKGLTPNGVTKPAIGASMCMRSTDVAVLFIHEFIHSSNQDIDSHFSGVLPVNSEEIVTNTLASLLQILFNS